MLTDGWEVRARKKTDKESITAAKLHFRKKTAVVTLFDKRESLKSNIGSRKGQIIQEKMKIVKRANGRVLIAKNVSHLHPVAKRDITTKNSNIII